MLGKKTKMDLDTLDEVTTHLHRINNEYAEFLYDWNELWHFAEGRLKHLAEGNTEEAARVAKDILGVFNDTIQKRRDSLPDLSGK